MPYNVAKVGEPGAVDAPELITKRAENRAQLKQRFLKLYTDPHIHQTGQGGFPFESAHQRYYAMKCAQKDFFKPNLYTFGLYAAIVIIPVLSVGLFIKNRRDEFERKCRAGEIPYKDRHPKL